MDRQAVLGVLCTLALVLVVVVHGAEIGDLRSCLTAEIQLGIDLGTTQSVAAICKQGKVHIVDVDGALTTPSTVWFDATGKDHVIGAGAVARREVDPDNVVYAAKRVIGMRYDDPEREEKVVGLPFKFEKVASEDSSNGDIGFRIPSSTKLITPEEVGSLVLRKLKRASEQSTLLDWMKRLFGFSFKSLTVSVPVTFTEDQKSATVRACRMAGFRQVRLIEEPIAAAIAYGLGKAKESNRVLVFDIGGGTLDVALLYYNAYSENFYVETTAGEAQLGGEDFDVIIANLVLEHVESSNPNLARFIRRSPSAWQSLLVSSEVAKRVLSSEMDASVCIPNIFSDDEALACETMVNITRDEFEYAGREKFELAMDVIQQVLDDAKLDYSASIDIVLVGGTSRIPAIRQDIGDLLPNAKLHYEGVDPDQAVAIGAAKSWGCDHVDQ